MPIVNKKLGNGFLVNAVDSSGDAEHYFGGGKKFVRAYLEGRTFSLTKVLTVTNMQFDRVVEYSGSLLVVGVQTGSDFGGVPLASGSCWRSTNGGSSWTSAPVHFAKSISDIHVGVDNNLYVCGKLGGGGAANPVVAKSTDSGQTWSTLGDASLDAAFGGVNAEAFSVTTQLSGASTNIFVCGHSAGNSNIKVAIICSSSDGGTTWATVDAFSGTAGSDTTNATKYTSILSVGSNQILAVGALKTGSVWCGFVRESVGSGVTGSWVTRATLYSSGTMSPNLSGVFKITKDSSGNIYGAGHYNPTSGDVDALLLKSHTSASNMWTYSDTFQGVTDPGNIVGAGQTYDIGFGVAVNDRKENEIYYVGQVYNSVRKSSFIRKSNNGGISWHTLFNESQTRQIINYHSGSHFQDVCVKNGKIYIVGNVLQNSVATGSLYILEEGGQNNFILSASKQFTTGSHALRELYSQLYDDNGAVINTASLNAIFGLDPSNAHEVINPKLTFTVKPVDLTRSFDGTKFSIEFADIVGDTWASYKEMKQYGVFTSQSDGTLHYESTFLSGSAQKSPKVKFDNSQINFKVSASDDIFEVKNVRLSFDLPLTNDGVKYYKELRNENNDRISGYMKANFLNKNIFLNNVNNISEFPHSSGLFQMKNLLVGTRDSGKIGQSEDAIIQIKHIGSVVHVMWPRQENATSPVRGYGDFSAGSRPGKLTTIFDPGDFINVEEYDHLALYCALRKELSGTMDDVVITVERRPIKSTGFSVDQSVEYITSGNFTEARLRDVQFKKQIDYGDLSLREISWPIDVPLANVKEVRISARHVVGQQEENKNFIVWGRLIKSSKDTNET